MPDGLYERDALAWAEQQAALLRRVAAGERVNDAVDWAHVIEEVADVGLSELRACRSLLRQAMVHLLKLHAEPRSQAAAHWQGEVAGFLTDARDRVQSVDAAAGGCGGPLPRRAAQGAERGGGCGGGDGVAGGVSVWARCVAGRGCGEAGAGIEEE